MGKKGKVGKQRKDNYYKLAKQKGFRSRAAFKLIQLNRKFQFLENSRVCIDLCAAPGGWLQVASEYMPVSSVIIGVDLVPILPIRNVITIQADITTKECTDAIKSKLSNWKADIVFHDGAPNIGREKSYDFFKQNELTLTALKIASENLRSGGWFITKVFRSSDYNSLLWVLGKLFGKVNVAKPQASRSESAEIFLVCQNYANPSEIDPKFFDPNYLFADISSKDETLKKQKADLLKAASKIKKAPALGYEDGDVLKKCSVSEFLSTNRHLEILATCHELVFTDPAILNHDKTSEEIQKCCKDLKVLGRRDILALLKWRRELRKDLTSQPENLSVVEDDAETIPELQLDDLQEQEEQTKRQELKRIKRKEEKRKKDYEQRVTYGMVNDGDILIEEENDLFKLPKNNQLDLLQDVEPEESLETENEPPVKQRKVTFSREDDIQYFDEDDRIEDKIEVEPKIAAPKAIKNNNSNSNLLSDLMDVSQPKVSAADKFFDATFTGVDLEKDFDLDYVDKVTSEPVKRDLSRFDDESSSDDDEERKEKPKNIQLDEEGYAIASLWLTDRKKLEDDGWNRYTHGDTHLAPKFFRDDEARFNSRPTPPEVAKQIKKKEIAQPIKKVLQAKMRQKRRAHRKMEKVKKKVDSITSNEDLTQRERVNQIRTIYKNATKTKKKETKVLVSKKGLPVKKPGKGKYKLVDARQKKDLRGKKDSRGKGKKQKRNKTRR